MNRDEIIYAVLSRQNPALPPSAKTLSHAKARLMCLAIALVELGDTEQCIAPRTAARALLDTSSRMITIRYQFNSRLPLGTGRKYANDKGGRIGNMVQQVCRIVTTEEDELSFYAHLFKLAFPKTHAAVLEYITAYQEERGPCDYNINFADEWEFAMTYPQFYREQKQLKRATEKIHWLRIDLDRARQLNKELGFCGQGIEVIESSLYYDFNEDGEEVVLVSAFDLVAKAPYDYKRRVLAALLNELRKGEKC